MRDRISIDRYTGCEVIGMRDIGKNIKELRQLKKLTQEELAEKLFVTRQTVSNYETGKSRPDIEMLTRIAETLETDPNTVLYGIPQKVNRERMILRLCISMGIYVITWLAYCNVVDVAKEIAGTTYNMDLALICRVFAGPAVAFLFGWTAMQVLSVLAKLSPLTGVWAKRLRWLTLGAIGGYLLIVSPFVCAYLLKLNLEISLADFLWKVIYWITGYVYGIHIKPNAVLFGILGCALWLGIPQKTKE